MFARERSWVKRSGFNGSSRPPDFSPKRPRGEGEDLNRDCDLGNLERDIATVAHNLGADLDELLPELPQKRGYSPAVGNNNGTIITGFRFFNRGLDVNLICRASPNSRFQTEADLIARDVR